MMRGSATANLDERGRAVIPAAFRKPIEQSTERDVFVISMDDKIIQIFPLASWHEHVDNLYLEKKDDPLMRQFLMKTN